MTVTNWIGQEIEVNSIVWRGARNGNSSSFKIGQVMSVNPVAGSARVRWLFEPRSDWLVREYIPAVRWENLKRVRHIESKGSPNVNSLVVINVDLNELADHADEWDELTEQAAEFRRRQATR